MNNQKGFYNLDFTGFFIALVVICALAGAGVHALIGWLWPIAKAFLHTITA